MPWNTLVDTLRLEISAAQGRASLHANTVNALLRANQESADAEQALFRELHGLTILRARLQAIATLRDDPIENAA